MTNKTTNNKTNDCMVLIQKAIKEPGTVSECFSLFKNYSLMNTLYIGYQQMKRFGTITPVKTMKQWNAVGRRINKGAKALEMLFPRMIKVDKKDKDGNIVKDKDGKPVKIEICTGYYPRKMHFAYTETNGEPMAKEKDLPNFNWQLACKNLGINIVEYNSSNGNCQGWSKISRKEIAINPCSVAPTQTAIHEITHALLHSGNECKHSREICEVQAETSTYIVLTMLGYKDDELSNCRGYIQHWLKDNELDEQICKEIINAANKILEAGTDKKKQKQGE